MNSTDNTDYVSQFAEMQLNDTQTIEQNIQKITSEMKKMTISTIRNGYKDNNKGSPKRNPNDPVHTNKYGQDGWDWYDDKLYTAIEYRMYFHQYFGKRAATGAYSLVKDGRGGFAAGQIRTVNRDVIYSTEEEIQARNMEWMYKEVTN